MHRASKTLVIGLLGLAATAYLAHAVTVTTVDPDEIQEDWQLVIGSPDPSGNGPQISTSMSPVEDGSTPFFIFNLNYCDYPTFSGGGLQAQAWSGDTILGATSKGTAQCSTNNETITWTQNMKISAGNVSFAVNSGKSTTWGKFGQGQQLDLSGVNFTTSLTSLARYAPTVTVANSGVGWEKNRVTSMTLLRVRYYAAGKLLTVDNTQRSINLQ